MARVRLPLDSLASGERTLEEAAARYVTRVHRLGVGARLVAFDPACAVEATCEVRSVAPRVVLHVGDLGPSVQLPRARVTVVQTASKGHKIEDVLRDATELGATRFVVAVGQRSVKRPDASQAARWRKVAVEAARQCGRGDIPELAGPMPLKEALAEPGERRWLLDPTGEPLARVERTRQTSAHALSSEGASSSVVIVGPEGGFDPEEVDLARGAGFVAVRLGDFVLRTETACAAALGALALLSGDE